MNKIVYLSYIGFLTCGFLSATEKRHAHFPQLVASAMALGKIHPLSSSNDFQHLRNVYAGDTIKTPVPQHLSSPGSHTTYHLEGQNFIQIPSEDGKYIFYTMESGPVKVVRTYESYNDTPGVQYPYLRHQSSYPLVVRSHEPDTYTAGKSCVKK